SRLGPREAIEVIGSQSSGEVECALLQAKGQLWLGVGSDHTDREVESYGVTVSKQMCDKPLASQFWSFDEVASHWDKLVLRSRIEEAGRRVLYQEGTVTAFRDPTELIEKFCGSKQLPEGTVMFCGTLAAQGGVRPSERF